MKRKKEVAGALNASLKYERTLADCFEQYWLYFARERIHRLRCWMREQKKLACGRKVSLMERLYRLDQVPDNDRYEVEVEPLKKAEDISDVVGYFLKTVTEAIDTAKTGREVCKDGDDPVSARLLVKIQEDLEDTLWRLEAKEFKIRIVGPVEYLAHHMHHEG